MACCCMTCRRQAGCSANVATTRSRGFSIVEMLTALAIGAMLLGGLYQLLQSTLGWSTANEGRNRAVLEAQFAFNRMVRSAAEGRVLVLPLDTAVRNHFAVTLPTAMDRNGDGFADADNDFDGRTDEDPGADLTFDGDDGIRGFDDDVDGVVDDGLLSGGTSDDEDLLNDEDPFDLVDNDADGLIDEDPGGGVDDDADGQTDEDGFDPALYYLAGNKLMEQVRVPWDVNTSGSVTGEDVVTSQLLENVTLLEARRESTVGGQTLLHLKMNVTDPSGEVISFDTSVRVGSRS